MPDQAADRTRARPLRTTDDLRKRLCAAPCPDSRGNPRVAQELSAVTTRLLQQFAAGPAATAHPAVDNLARLGIDRTADSPTRAASPPAQLRRPRAEIKQVT